MTRKLKKIQKGETCRVGVILTSDIVQKLDAAVKRLALAVPGSTVTRSDVVRRAIYEFSGK